MKPMSNSPPDHRMPCWPLALIPTTSNSAAAASSPGRPRPAARPTWSSARAASRPATARPRNAPGGEPGRASCSARRSELIELDGDAHLEVKAAHAIRLAGVIRRLRPAIVLAPSLVENQHPDHCRLGRLVRDAARIARYGGVAELRAAAAARDRAALLLRDSPEAEPARRVADPRRRVGAGGPGRLDRRDGGARDAGEGPPLRRDATDARPGATACGPASATPSPSTPTTRSSFDSLARLGRGASRF